MGFSVSDGRGRFEYSGTPWGLFARPAHLVSPTFLGMLRDWRRFNREARALIGMNGTAPSLGHWLEQQGFSRHFIERLIVPQASAVWSADPEQMWSFPASFMAEFFDNHGMYSLRDRPTLADRRRRLAQLRRGDLGALAPSGCGWRRRCGGSSGCRSGVRIEAEGCESEEFDEVVIATHSDQALALLADPSEPERRSSARSPTSATRPSCTPTPRCCRGGAPPGRAGTSTSARSRARRSTVTYWMNNLQRLRAEREYLLTLNRGEAIDPAKVLRRFSYDHPVYTARGRRRPGAATPRSAARAAPTTAAPTGAGASTRTASSAPCAPARIAAERPC